MRHLKFGSKGSRRPKQCARAPHQLRRPDQENRRHRSEAVWFSWENCPREIRTVLGAMLMRARIEKDDAAHVARQLWYTVKKKLVDLASMSAIPVLCEAKSRYVNIKFLLGSQVVWLQFLPAEIQPV